MAANTELVVFYLPNLHEDEEELLYGGLPAIRSLRSSLFRRTMGLILQGLLFSWRLFLCFVLPNEMSMH